MRAKNFAVLIATVAIAGCIVCMLVFDMHLAVSERLDNQIVNNSLTLEQERSPKIGSHTDSVPASVVESSSFDLEVANSTNWRVTVLSLMNHPERGGHSYAYALISQCELMQKPMGRTLVDRSVAEEIQTTATVSSKRVVARARLKQRCADFSESELDELSRTLRPGRQSEDLFARLTRDLVTAKASGDDRALMQAAQNALNTRDPYFLSASQGLAIRLIAGEGSHGFNGYWFDGQIYPLADGNAVSTYLTALQLAACNGSGFCGLDQVIEMRCVVLGECYSSRDEYVIASAKLSGFKGAEIDRMFALAGKMTSSIQNADAKAFRSP